MQHAKMGRCLIVITTTIPNSLLARARSILDIEIQGLEAVQQNLDNQFITAIEILERCKGRIIVTGMGKSGHIGKKMAATFSSTGSPAFFLHPAEGSHGDLGMITSDDVVLAISNSGESPEINAMLPLVKRFGIPLIAMTANSDSTLAKQSDLMLNIAVPQEACPLGLAPTASTTATLALGDALAVILLERRNFSPEDFARVHPAGALGKKLLLTVSDLMHQGDTLPIVTTDTSFSDALIEMSGKKLGMTLVIDDQSRLAGILTDGDIRRALTQEQDLTKIQLSQVMTKQPKRIEPTELAVTALRLMETHQITVLVVLNPDQTPKGVLHLHDILKTGIR